MAICTLGKKCKWASCRADAKEQERDRKRVASESLEGLKSSTTVGKRPSSCGENPQTKPEKPTQRIGGITLGHPQDWSKPEKPKTTKKKED
jgi:hypothetical protein